MAQYGGEQYRKEEGHQHTDESGHNPLHSGPTGHQIGGTGTTCSTTAGHEFGGTGATMTTGAGQGYEHEKLGGTGTGTGTGTGGILHRTGSGSSSSSESDGEGGKRKKKGVVEKVKEKLPGGDHGSDERKASETATVGGGGYGYEGEEGHEKKGLMDKIKEKLPGSH